MKTLNLPRSWDRMNFKEQMYYLCNSHQAKNLCDAAKIITKRTNDRIRATLNEIRAKAAWYGKDANA